VDEHSPEASQSEIWVPYVDGASNDLVAGAGLVLESPRGVLTNFVLKFVYKVTNNEAEYREIIAERGVARATKVRKLKVKSD